MAITTIKCGAEPKLKDPSYEPTFSNHLRERYLSDRSPSQMYAKVGTVAGTTLVGAGIGAAAGSVAGGIGAGPGAGIGAAAGFTAGVGIVLAWEYSEFSNHMKSLSEKASEEVHEKFKDACEIGLQCPISYKTMYDRPVMVPTCPNETFEYKDLVETIKTTKLCPMTRKPLTLEDIREDITVYSVGIQCCDKILQDPEKCPENRTTYTLYKKHCEKRMKAYVKNETTHLLKKVQNSEATTDEIIAKLQKLSAAEKGKRIE